MGARGGRLRESLELRIRAESGSTLMVDSSTAVRLSPASPAGTEYDPSPHPSAHQVSSPVALSAHASAPNLATLPKVRRRDPRGCRERRAARHHNHTPNPNPKPNHTPKPKPKPNRTLTRTRTRSLTRTRARARTRARTLGPTLARWDAVARPEDMAPEDDAGFRQATLPLALTPTLTSTLTLAPTLTPTP